MKPWHPRKDHHGSRTTVHQLYRLLGIEGNPSTAYHPQTDGQTERVNTELETYLRAFVNYRQDDWEEWLPLAEFAYNDKWHLTTGQTPFFLNSVQHPWKGIEPPPKGKNEATQQFADQIWEICKEATAMAEKAAAKQKEQYNKKKAPARNYMPGDRVWLDSRNITTTRPSKKLDDKHVGPFEVTGKTGAAAYKLKLPVTWKRKHPVFNEGLLKPYRPPAFPGQNKPLPPIPDIVDNELEYEVEKVLDSRMKRGKLEYLVHWKGYPNEERTWEPEANLGNAKAAVTEFHRQYPNAPRRVSEKLRFMEMPAPLTQNVPLEAGKIWDGWYRCPARPLSGKVFNWMDGKALSRGRNG